MSRFETPDMALRRAQILAQRETQRQKGFAAKVRQMRQRMGARPALSLKGQGIVTERHAGGLSSPERERFTMLTPAEQLREARGSGRLSQTADIGSPAGEAVFPGVVGKIPGLRTPAEAASTLGTFGLGSGIPLSARVGGAALGAAGAFGGGEVAEEAGAPRWTGELIGGAGLGLAGGVAGPMYARRAGETIRSAGGVRQMAASEAGGTRIPRGAPKIEEGVSPVSKLTNLIRQAKPVRAETEVLKSEELGRRAGRVADIASEQRGRGGLAAVRAEQRGELPRATFEPPEAGLEQFEADDLFNTIWASNKRPFEKGNIAGALEDVLVGNLPTRGQIKMLEDVFGSDIAKALLSKRSLGQKSWENFVDTLNIPRTVLSSFDVSAPLRQAVIPTISRPRQSVPAMGTMFRAFGSERVAKQVDDTIRNSPNFALKEQSGLYIAPRGVAAEVAEREESFMSRLAEVIPGVKQSQRAYTTYLNKLRSDVFDSVTQNWEGMGRTAKDYSDLANWLNHATGRGDLPGLLKGSAGILNATFFSPRLLASRLQMPVDAIISSGAVRKEIARDLGTSVGLGMTILALVKYSGAADVNLNPQSPDFGKLKMGNQRIDFWGGFQPIARYGAQAAAGIAAGDKDKVERTLLRFLRSKLAPVPGTAANIYEGETFVGEEINPDMETLQDEALRQLTPMFAGDLYESIKEEGIVGGLRASPGILGVGVQAYKPWVNPKYPPEFKELSSKEQQELTDFLDLVAETRDHWRETGTDTKGITWDESIDAVAKFEKKDKNLIEWAKILHDAER